MRVQQRGKITCCLGTAVTWYMRGSFAKVLQHKTLIFLIPTLITEYLLIIDNFNVEIQAFFLSMWSCRGVVCLNVCVCCTTEGVTFFYFQRMFNFHKSPSFASGVEKVWKHVSQVPVGRGGGRSWRPHARARSEWMGGRRGGGGHYHRDKFNEVTWFASVSARARQLPHHTHQHLLK